MPYIENNYRFIGGREVYVHGGFHPCFNGGVDYGYDGGYDPSDFSTAELMELRDLFIADLEAWCIAVGLPGVRNAAIS